MVAKNFFQKPAPNASAKRGSNSRAKDQIEVPGLENYAAIDYLIKALETLKKQKSAEIVDTTLAKYFAEKGALSKLQPDNPEGTEGLGSASCELRKRSSASPLKDEEIALVELAKLPVAEVTKFSVNEDYIGNDEILERVSKALSKDKEIPADFFTAKTTVQVTDETLKALFLKPEAEIEALSKIVGTYALKPKFDGDFEKAAEFVTKIISPDEDEEANSHGTGKKPTAKKK
jgi:hypothetical protein